MLLQEEKKVKIQNQKEIKWGKNSSLWAWLCSYGIQIEKREPFGNQTPNPKTH